MNSVTVYIIKIIAIVSASALCEALTDVQMTKTIRFVCGLCICITVFSFLSFKGEDVFDFSTKDYKSAGFSLSYTYEERLSTELEKQISSNIYENFGIMPEEVCINISIENENVQVREIDVVFSENVSESVMQSVSNHLRLLFGAETKTSGRIKEK